MHQPTAAPDFVQQSDRIAGVFIVHLRSYTDERGRFMETFRREWFPWVDWTQMQSNRSDSQAGVLRGLHFHRHQSDYWIVMRGRIRVGMADLRRSSPTFMATICMELDQDSQLGLLIPPGVAHGFLALTDTTLTYIVNRYYDSGDELGVAWDDPQIGLPWGIAQPVLSGRDAHNRPLAELEPELPF